MKRKLILFLAVCFGLSLVSAGLFRFLGGVLSTVPGTLFSAGYMMIPLLSVLAVQSICGERLLADCGVGFKINRWWFVAGFGMIVLAMLSVLVSALMPGTELTLESDVMKKVTDAYSANGLSIGPWAFIGISLASALVAGATVNAVFAFGEEIAWRGFLARIMDHLGFWRKSLIIGAIWGVWHAPLILMGHNYPSHPVIGVFMMTAFCILVSPLFMYFRERSGSVVVAAVAHGTMNAVAGMALLLLAGYDELLCGVCGLAGMIVMGAADLLVLGHSQKHE